MPSSRSKRGTAAFLSCLRVFTELIHAKVLDQPQQDAVLRVFHVLTRFPPALLSVYTLMRGETPRPSQCAALAQAFFETLKTIVPLDTVDGDENRILGGSRLLFGLILAKGRQQVARAKQQTISDSSMLPYLSSFKVVELLNTVTLQPIVCPVYTSIGLLEKGYFEAYQDGRILSWSSGDVPPKMQAMDGRTRRLVLLSGGLLPKVTILDGDELNSSLLRQEYLCSFSGEQAYGELHSLSALCEREGLSIVSPSALPRSEAPALTLDREGLIAVYLGRQSCGEPGKEQD